MRNKYNHIPETLQGKVIAITGTGPGTGKSYSKNYMLESFKRLGYQVEPLGSANKNCSSILGKGKTVYSFAGWTDFEECKKTKSYKRIEDDKAFVHHKTYKFLFVDEAMMLSQEDIDLLKKQYPKCCIIVIGDANQFSPIGEVIGETYIDEDTGIEMNVPEEFCEKIHGSTIKYVDYCFEMNKNYRQENDVELQRVLKSIKEGISDPHLLYKFLKERPCTRTEQFAICRTKKGIIDWKDSDIEGVYRAIKNTEMVYNSQLFDTEGINLDTGDKINIPANEYYTDQKGKVSEALKLVKGVTCHRIQGCTFKKEIVVGKVVIDIDDALSIIKDVNNKYQIEDFLRFLYVAISRFESSDQITFKFSKKNIEKLADVASHAMELKNNITPNESLSSQEFCEKISPSYLEEVLKVQEVVTNSADLAYIYNNNNIYAKCGEKVTTLLSKKIDAFTAAKMAWAAGYNRNCNRGIRKFLVDIGCNHHNITENLDLIFDIIDILSDGENEKKDNVAMSIGDIEKEVKEKESIEDNLDALVEVEIEKCAKEKDKAMFRDMWSKKHNIERYEFIKEMIEKHYM